MRLDAHSTVNSIVYRRPLNHSYFAEIRQKQGRKKIAKFTVIAVCQSLSFSFFRSAIIFSLFIV
jgi:hypothetical protein